MLIIAYLIGSLSFAIIISKIMKMDDPRNYGSQNAGATNVMRSGNKKAAVFTLLGDLLKGLIVVLIARFVTRGIDGGDAIVGICGVMAVIGHIYPVFFRFKGGKGVATALGVLLGFSPLLALLLALSWLIIFKLSRVSSLAAIVATILSPLYAYFLMGNSSYFGATTIIAFFVVYKHKMNIIRLIRGTEGSFKKTAQGSSLQTAAVGEDEPVDNLTRLKSGNPAYPNYYDLLAVSEDASQDEIKVAYHNLSLNLQPEDEAFPAYDDGSAVADRVTEKTLHKVQEAYSILSDPVQRKIYDQSLNAQKTATISND